MNDSDQATLRALLHGDLAGWAGLPPGTSIAFFQDLYGHVDDGLSGRLAGHWVTYFDFPPTPPWPALRVWRDDGTVVRLDLEEPAISNHAGQLDQLGSPSLERRPAVGYRFVGEDELMEFVYADRGLALHVTDPTLPGGSGEAQIMRIRAFTPMSVAAYDRDLGGKEPARRRRPYR